MTDLGRLCKLRRLSGDMNPNEHERAAAEAKLEELLDRHGLTHEDLDQHEDQKPMGPLPPGGWYPFGPGVVIVVGGEFGGFGSSTTSSTITGFGFSFTL